MFIARDIDKSFKGQDAEALKSVSLTVDQGEFLSLVGRSGSGKTTLLNVLSTLLRPDRGELRYNGEDLALAGEKRLNQLRHKDFAVIFQFHYLLPYLTALENTLLPFMNDLAPVSRGLLERAKQSLERVGLAGKHNRLPSMLSGGEQQRVAISRALVKEAQVLFADEPTGSLDRATGQGVMELLAELNQEGMTIVMVTHDPEYAAHAHRIVSMEDGEVLEKGPELAPGMVKRQTREAEARRIRALAAACAQ